MSAPLHFVFHRLFIKIKLSLYSTYDFRHFQRIRIHTFCFYPRISEGDTQLRHRADYTIEVPAIAECLMPIVSIIPLQLMAYYIAMSKGRNVDQPRNLAKSVTVE